jgi:hypothetical protein
VEGKPVLVVNFVWVGSWWEGFCVRGFCVGADHGGRIKEGQSVCVCVCVGSGFSRMKEDWLGVGNSLGYRCGRSLLIGQLRPGLVALEARYVLAMFQ